MSSSSCRPARRWLQRAFLLLCLAGLPLLNACTSPPDGVSVVSPFDVKRYAGQWFEIARLDHRFERGLTRVSAQYVLRDDGAPEYPLILAISYPDLAAVDAALASPARAEGKAATESVLERFFALYCAPNSFTRLRVKTVQRDEEVATWPARAGEALVI